MQSSQTITAVYENGVLRPLEIVKGLSDQDRVQLIISSIPLSSHPVNEFVGILSEEEADAIQQIIQEEFEKVDINEW